MEEKKLFLLDAYALIYRAYYALINSPRVTSGGMNTSAVFGFCNTLDEILRSEKPGYIAVCFDPKGGHTFRHDAYPQYKAQRDKQPEDITASIPYIKRILQAHRIPVIEIPGYEADDIIGSLARRAEADGFTTYMMTPDKDYGQLVDTHTFMYRPALKGKGFEIRGPREVCERYGIAHPRQVIDLLALEGDASDNVPGCPGVGEKTASKLIAQWGSVEGLLDHVGDLKGALREKIENNAEQIRFSKFLVTIKTDVPLPLSPADLLRQEPDIEALAKVYDELEFKTFAAKLRPAAPAPADAAPKAQAAAAPNLFDFDNAEGGGDALTATETGFTKLDGLEHAARFVARAVAAPAVGLWLEAGEGDAMSAELHGIALNISDHESAFVELPPRGMGRDEWLAVLAPLFANDKTTLVSADVKRDMILLRRENVGFTARYFDVGVAHYILSPETSHSPGTLAAALLKRKSMDFDLTPAEVKAANAATPSRREKVAAQTALFVRLLEPVLRQKIEEQGQTRLLEDIELPFVRVLADMEWEGVRIDVAQLSAQRRTLTKRIAELEAEVYGMAGVRFNIGSPMQVGEVLFGKMQIDPTAKKTKRGAWSTTEEVLEKYRAQHPIVGVILEIRGLKKLLTTYVEALPKLVNPSTGRIHTTFNQTVTATGRISSTNPNLQNIPIRTDEGRQIRKAFIPTPGDVMLSADYSQIELRLMAELSGDPTMIEAFAAHEDIHRATAAKIYHVPLADVTDDQRRAAKTANFGIIYGISAFGLSERLGISRAEAKALKEGYLKTYQGVDGYMKRIVDQAREQESVSTIMGRKRFLPEINSRNAVVRGYAERNAINAPLQGSAADIIKVAMINIDREIKERGMKSRMIIQVHDELVFNVPPAELAQLTEIVVRLMMGAHSGRVPLEVSVGTGTNWLQAH